MNLTSVLEKATIIFFVALCYVTIFTSVDAQRSVRVIKTKLTSPLHIHLPGGPNHGSYAKRYGYGRPAPNYNFQGKNKNYPERRNRKFGPKNYANDFRNWTPNRFQGGKYNPRADNGKYHPRADNGKRGPQRPRKEPYPFIREPPFKNGNQKRKLRPQGPSHLQRPQPPKLLKDFDEEYYFPEEAIKAETQHDYEVGYKPKKKRRNPSDVEKILRRPESKGPYYNGGKVGKSSKQKTRDSSAGLGSYVKWPSPDDDDEDEVDVPEHTHQTTKTKKKKIKKKSHSKKKIKDTEYDQDDSAYDSDTTERSSKKRIKKQPYQVKDEEDKKYNTANSGLSATGDFIHAYNENQKPQGISSFNPPYQQTWSQIVGTTQRAVPFNTYNTNNNNNLQSFQPQQFATANQFNIPQQSRPNHFSYQNFVQKPQIITADNQHSSFFSQPDHSYTKNVIFGSSNSPDNNNNNYNYNSNYANNQLSTERAQISASYSTYSFQPSNGNYIANNPTYHSQYSTNANQYNPNGYIKNQSLSFIDNSQKYGNRVTASYQSSASDAEADFLKKHQSLYNKGLTGVPIQGDGYRKDSAKGDYDIGYGDFQFDENTGT